jgi:acyl-CoA thioesterase
MMESGMDILGHTWRRREPGQIIGSFDESWAQGRTIFGGLVAAVLARAAEDAVGDAERLPRSITVQFSAPVLPGEATAKADVVRAGKYVTQLTAALEQGGHTVATALAAFGATRPHPLSHRASAPPELPPFERLPSLPRLLPGAPAFTQHVDFRFCLGSPPFSGAEKPEVGGWCRLRQPSPPDVVTLCALLDAWPLPALAMLKSPRPGATIDLSYHFLAPLPLEGVGDDEPYAFRCVSPTVADGYAEQLGELWTADGLLVARVRQIAAIF